MNLFTTPQLAAWVEQVRSIASQGKLPTYIPLLAQADSNWVAVAIADSHGEILQAGNIDRRFPLMSVVKPFILLYVLETVGAERVFDRVDRVASTEPFNVIPQGKPQNPMLNAGAITIASLLPSCDRFCEWLNQQAGTQLYLDERMLASVRSLSHRRNQEIVQVLEDSGYIENADAALAIYEQVCCLSATVEDCARLGLLLACDRIPSNRNLSGQNLSRRISDISKKNRQIVAEIVTTCGMYAASAQFMQEVGLPSKSAVSGIILSLIPDRGAIAVYSPTLDAIGNSVAGLFLVKQIDAALRAAINSRSLGL
ncbi:glutaminase [Tumidithrix elongata RA019]|uniref:glutaminase n=1 Tax=Tumidithrix elongata BACA0141 TaxID=2716417 RepID=A0AAW9PZA8_9CYAN|nr:glutaminase [Tumidithrix elongata RA019]